MPEHRLLAVLGVFEIDPVVVQMAPDLGGAEVAIEVLEDRHRIEELLLRLVDQVDAVSVEHLAVALQHPHHLQQVIRGVAQQGFAGQQAPLHLLAIDREVGLNQLSGNDGHLSSRLRAGR